MSKEQEIDDDQEGQERWQRWLLDAEPEERRDVAFWRERLAALLDEETRGTRPDVRAIVARAPLDVVMFLCAQIPDDRFFIKRLREHREFKRQCAPNDTEYFGTEPEGEVVVLHGIHSALDEDPITWEARWSQPFRAWLARRSERVGGGPKRPGDPSETGAGPTSLERSNAIFIVVMIALVVVAAFLFHQLHRR